MIKWVIKSNGKKEEFNRSKLRGSMEKAIISAGHSLEKKKIAVDNAFNDIIDKLKDKVDIRSSELREKVLKALDKHEGSASDAWRRFDEKYKATKSMAW